MKCNICDKELTEKEIVWNSDLKAYEPCTTCLDIALDAAFSDGFSRPDEEDKYVLIEEEDSSDHVKWYDILYGYSTKDEDYREGEE